MTIWKYELAMKDTQVLSVPVMRKALSVQMQHGVPCLWMLVDQDSERRDLTVRIVGTGHPCDDVMASDYVGTFQKDGGWLVFHVFVSPA